MPQIVQHAVLRQSMKFLLDLTLKQNMPKLNQFLIPIFVSAIARSFSFVNGCTNIIVTPGASKDASMMLAYNGDGSDYFGSLYHYPASKGNKGKMRKIYDWMTGEFLGEIPEADVTYNVMGNCNEFGLCLAESSWESIDLLKKGKQENALIDYGSLMFITLQRCKSASEAIDTMASLMDSYGYASLGGETFSIVDGKEAWIMDVVGRGEQKVGAVWVAQRVPDGTVVAMANRVKTKVFPQNDPDNCRYSADVVHLARELGLYQGEDDGSFNFQATYSTATPASTHFSQSRILDIYSHLLPNQDDFYNTYINYVMSGGVGLNDTSDDLPLWIQPQQKLTLNDVRDRLSSHYEGTSLDYGSDLASGLFFTPYRPKPLTWEYQKKTYFNERPVANEFTGTSFISVIRGWMPLPLQAIVWVGMDDSSTCPRYPVYASSVAGSQFYIGKGSQDGVPTTQIMKFDPQKAFWIQNLVSNIVYSRWSDAYPVLKDKLDEVHEKFEREVAKVDKEALSVYLTLNNTRGDVWSEQNEIVVQMLTTYSVAAGDELQKIWSDFFAYLFPRFRDLIIMEEKKSNKNCGCEPIYIGLEESWKQRIIAERGDHYLVPDLEEAPTSEKGARPISRSVTLFTVWLLIIVIAAIGFSAIRRHFTRDYKKVGLVSSEEFSSDTSNGLITESTHSACYGATDTNQALQMASAPSE